MIADEHQQHHGFTFVSGQSVFEFISSRLEYFIDFSQEFLFGDEEFMETIADQTFIEPNFAFMVLTQDYHLRINIKRTHPINQSLEAND